MESWPSLDSAGSLNDFCGHAQIRGLIIQPRTAIRGNIHCYLTKSVSSPYTVFSNFSSLKIFSESSIFEGQFIWVIKDSGPNLVFQVSRACVVIVNQLDSFPNSACSQCWRYHGDIKILGKKIEMLPRRDLSLIVVYCPIKPLR